SNLDAKLRVQTRVELKKLHERLATTIVYVTHDQVEAMTMGDRIVVMKDGIIQQVGSPLELYNAPNNKFVAGFIGSPAMNFFEAELIRSGALLSLQTDSFRIDLPPEKTAVIREYSEKKVIVGIRPEDLLEAKEHVPGKTIQTTVDVIEPIGSEIYLNVSAGEVPLTASVDRKAQVKPHQDFIVEPALDYLHLFDIRNENILS
ncbi:MAG: ABC transporter ATP-binding protein, partial [Thermodesulfobacteriota bacterium]